MLYTLNVYSDVCPLFLNKTRHGREEKRIMVPKVIQRPLRPLPRFLRARGPPTKAMGTGLPGTMGVPTPPGRAVVSATQSMVIVIAAEAY